MINRRHFLLGSSLLLLGTKAMAEPSRDNVKRLIFGYPPGALGSQLAQGALRVLADTSDLQYVLQNVDARNTRQALEDVKNSMPNGHTLLQAHSTSMCLLPNVYKKLGYDPIQDFTSLGTVGEVALSLTVGPLVPPQVTNLEQFHTWLLKNADLREIGFSIYGSEGHLATLMLGRSLGMSTRPQPYKGSAAMLNDLASGALLAGFTAAGNGKPEWWTSGKLRSLGVTSAKRLSYWPNIPSLQEQGVSDMDMAPWYAWFAPSATPLPILTNLREGVRRMQTAPAFSALQRDLLVMPLELTPEALLERIRQQTARYAALVKTYDIDRLD